MGLFEMPDNHVLIEEVTFRRDRRAVINQLSISVPRGKIVALMGPSGTGKTTLLGLIGGQLKPVQGRIIVDGQNIGELNRAQLFQARKNIGMLFQSGALFTDLSVFENVAFPLRVHTNLPDDMIRDIVLIKLQSVGLRGTSALMPSELSGGMARRVALARAVALDPALILYDEPFTGLDPIAKGVIVQLIKNLNETLGVTSIIVSHNINETAAIADIIYIISDGKVIGSGSPESLLKDQSPRISQFIQGLPDGPVPFHYPAMDLEQELMDLGVD